MKDRFDEKNPLRAFFFQSLHDSFHSELGIDDAEDVENYLANMLTGFVHEDSLYDIRNAAGQRVESVAEMIAEGDIRLNASSFEREREVHQHIGDFLLFWSGLFPEFLPYLKGSTSRDILIDVVEQGKMSYGVAASFEYPPYDAEAKTLGKLSERFTEYQFGLRRVRSSFEGFAQHSDWTHGFRA